LAFFDREDIKSRLLDNSDFKSYLELEPHIREAAQAFYSARYSVTLDILDRHRPDFVVDIFLSSHVDTLYKEIRQKALVQAFDPYSTVELATLSTLFSTPIPELATEIVQLIEHGKIKARLDNQKNVMQHSVGHSNFRLLLQGKSINVPESIKSPWRWLRVTRNLRRWSS
jgi:COP9 signalosome complex subunit 1